jgi:integrase
MYKGVRYRVSCADLRAPVPTCEGSYKLANDWWRGKLAELYQPDPVDAILSTYQPDDLKEMIRKGEAARQLLQSMPADRREPVNVDFTTGIFDTPNPRLEHLTRLANTVESNAVEPDLTLDRQAERFLAVQQARNKKPGTFGDLAYYIRRFPKDCPHLRPALDVGTINEATVTDVYSWLRMSSGHADAVQKKLWGYFRRLVRFIASQRLCPIPLNLDDKTFSFGVSAKKIKTYSVEEVRTLLKSLPDRLKLYALLALNCGMLGVDMANLKHRELKDGRITRKRTKTGDGENVPTVEYLLWPETRRLLAKYPSTHPEYVLTSKSGTPLFVRRIVDGKVKKKDLVSLQWRRGRGEGRAKKPAIQLKALRSVASTLLDSHKDYGRLTSLFLGHAPATVKDKYYAAPPQELFDEAVLWLRSAVLGKKQR